MRAATQGSAPARSAPTGSSACSSSVPDGRAAALARRTCSQPVRATSTVRVPPTGGGGGAGTGIGVGRGRGRGRGWFEGGRRGQGGQGAVQPVGDGLGVEFRVHQAGSRRGGGRMAVGGRRGAGHRLDHPRAGETDGGTGDRAAQVAAGADGDPDPAGRGLVRHGDMPDAGLVQRGERQRHPGQADEPRDPLGTTAAQERHQRTADGRRVGRRRGEAGRVRLAEASAVHGEVPHRRDRLDPRYRAGSPPKRRPSVVVRPAQAVG